MRGENTSTGRGGRSREWSPARSAMSFQAEGQPDVENALEDGVEADHPYQSKRARARRIPIPNSIEMIPHRIRNDSFSISFRSRIAPMIWKIPTAITHPAMKKRRTRAVMPGQAKVRIPAAIPRSPIAASHQRGAGAPPMTADMSASKPSMKAYTPYTTTSVSSVSPGKMNASTPKPIATMPRSNRIHQFFLPFRAASQRPGGARRSPRVGSCSLEVPLSSIVSTMKTASSVSDLSQFC
jgi:hypothetical protein